jgi:hypothetical protein
MTTPEAWAGECCCGRPDAIATAEFGNDGDVGLGAVLCPAFGVVGAEQDPFLHRFIPWVLILTRYARYQMSGSFDDWRLHKFAGNQDLIDALCYGSLNNAWDSTSCDLFQE